MKDQESCCKPWMSISPASRVVLPGVHYIELAICYNFCSLLGQSTATEHERSKGHVHAAYFKTHFTGYGTEIGTDGMG